MGEEVRRSHLSNLLKTVITFQPPIGKEVILQPRSKKYYSIQIEWTSCQETWSSVPIFKFKFSLFKCISHSAHFSWKEGGENYRIRSFREPIYNFYLSIMIDRALASEKIQMLEFRLSLDSTKTIPWNLCFGTEWQFAMFRHWIRDI